MTIINKNSNWYNAITPNGDFIENVRPIEQNFSLEHLFDNEKQNDIIFVCPLPYRTTIASGVSTNIKLLIIKDKLNQLNFYLENDSNFDIKYTASVFQAFGNGQTDIYKQFDNEVNTLEANSTSNKALMELSLIGLQTMEKTGNDSGKIDLTIKINNVSINNHIEWHTPLKELNADGFLSIKTIDRCTNYI